jgi:hypothetical protein
MKGGGQRWPSPPAMPQIFVFGSNLAGRHGKGAALTARNKYGAIYGQGIGRQGASYAIPTKDERLNTLSIPVIQKHVLDFIAYATIHHELTFNVTRIGCGLAGYKDEDIAPLFKDAPENCILSEEWRKHLGKNSPMSSSARTIK